MWSIFQGQTSSLQEIFGHAIWTLGPSWSGPVPQKQTFLPNQSPPTVLGQGGQVIPFRNREEEAKKCWEQNLDYRPRARENWARRRGWPGVGGDQNFGISTFFLKGAPTKIRHWLFLVFCNFLIQRYSRAPGVPSGASRVKIRSPN